MITRRLALLALAAGAAAVLAGCAHPQLVDMGQTRAQVVEQLGEPDAEKRLPDGRVRMVYSMQPMGEEVWWIFLDAQGRVVGREQGLQEKYFSAIVPGQWTEKDVWEYWGRCAQKFEFRLVNEHAWMYRYRDAGGFWMAVWPQFDVHGVVRSVETTTDPWHDSDHHLFGL